MQTLASPLTLGPHTLRNRIVMAPMVVHLARPDGSPSDNQIEYYGQRADAETAMIIVEATAVDPGGLVWSGGLSVFSDACVQPLARLAERIKKGGALACLQLVHGGPQSSPEMCGGEIVGPSAVRASSRYPVARPLTLEELEAIQQRFASAAQRAAAAGFDAIEIHGAHGYLLDSFLSPVRNQRQDRYGGSLAQRMTMLRETLARVRAALPAHVLLGCRFSIFNHVHEGFSLADLKAMLSILNAADLDLLHFSADGWSRQLFDQNCPQTRLIRGLTRLPLIVAGGLGTFLDAIQTVENGDTDLVAVGRAMRTRPDWSVRALQRVRRHQAGRLATSNQQSPTAFRSPTGS